MDNPHPRWGCYRCHREWHWIARPVSCGFCACTYIMAVSENAKALVAFEQGVTALARTGMGRIIRPRRVSLPRSQSITAGSKARLGW